ncbi:protein-glutamate methylesterase/protein-glutamine glutaminase [Acidovorax facilis]|uniref:protein-glutamate methylesterase/protein-glutamine glutaminase n=1 Tax=Acidovorax facilis TaxID=12917 RepID=UPI003CF375BE
MREKIKVLIVDDSAVVRQVVAHAIEREPRIEVIGTAQDPVFALEKMKTHWPDVLIVDIEMPRMDGLTFLKKIMSERPTPIVICSTLAERGAQVTMDALLAGAVSIITKPKAGIKSFLEDSASDIIQAIKAAACVNVNRLRPSQARAASPPTAAPQFTPAAPSSYATTDKLVAFGTSTGGTQALEAVLTQLPPICPGIVIVQHMPERFTALFAQRLNTLCQIEVREARDGDRVRTGLALVAPGGRHMTVRRSGAQYVIEVRNGPLVNRHKPSVDVLFRSVAHAAGKNAMGIIMTGMGDDGARGLKEMHDAGAQTVAEDESTCVVFGMPKEAIKHGAVNKAVPLNRIPYEIMNYAG